MTLILHTSEYNMTRVNLYLISFLLLSSLHLIVTKYFSNSSSINIHTTQGMNKPGIVTDIDFTESSRTDKRATASSLSLTVPRQKTNIEHNFTNSVDGEIYTSPASKFPQYSWEDKMKRYYNGRQIAAIQYPLGLNYTGVEQLSDNVFAIDKERLREQSSKQDLLSHATFDDKSAGSVTLSEVVPGGVFDRMGMLPGDQVQSINGNKVTNYSDLYTAYENSINGDQITLHIIRSNQQVDFTYFLQ